MSYLTLADIQKRRPGPYPGSTKAVVAIANAPIKYTNQGEEKQSMVVGLCDDTASLKGVVYDPQQFPRFKQGSTVSLRNVILRDRNTVVITKTTKSFSIKHMNVPEDRISEAVSLINPPPSPIIPIKEALASPMKTIVSISGQIVQEDQQKEVLVGSTPTKVKNIFLKDSSTDRVKVSLWREMCSVEHRPGDYIAITNVVTTQFRGETHFSVTSCSTIKATEPPVQQKIVSIEGIGGDAHQFELLSDEGESFMVAGELLRMQIPLDQKVEEYIISHAPVKMSLTLSGETVTSVELS